MAPVLCLLDPRWVHAQEERRRSVIGYRLLGRTANDSGARSIITSFDLSVQSDGQCMTRKVQNNPLTKREHWEMEASPLALNH